MYTRRSRPERLPLGGNHAPPVVVAYGMGVDSTVPQSPVQPLTLRSSWIMNAFTSFKSDSDRTSAGKPGISSRAFR